MTSRQFAPGDPLLICATATDVTAAQLSRGENAWLRVGPGDVVEAGAADNARNSRVQARYDALMHEGKHGHYETMFRIVREEVAAALASSTSVGTGEASDGK